MPYYLRHTIRVIKINSVRHSTLPLNWRGVLQIIVAAVTQNYRFRIAESIWIFPATKYLITSIPTNFISNDDFFKCGYSNNVSWRWRSHLRKNWRFSKRERGGEGRGGEGRGGKYLTIDWNGMSCRHSNVLPLQTPTLQCPSSVWTDFDKWLKAVTIRQTTNQGWLWLSPKTWNSSQAKAVGPEISFSAERRDPWIWLPVEIY